MANFVRGANDTFRNIFFGSAPKERAEPGSTTKGIALKMFSDGEVVWTSQQRPSHASMMLYRNRRWKERSRKRSVEFEHQSTYNGWIPVFTRRLSFDCFGDSKHSEKAVSAHTFGEPGKLGVCFQRRSGKDGIVPTCVYEEFPRIQ